MVPIGRTKGAKKSPGVKKIKQRTFDITKRKWIDEEVERQVGAAGRVRVWETNVCKPIEAVERFKKKKPARNAAAMDCAYSAP